MRASGPLIVALEGIDGTGKSTFASALVAALPTHINGRVVHTPGPAIKRMAFELRNGASTASFLAFMIGNTEAIRQHSDADVLVLDRYVLSTMVHHHQCSNVWLQELDSLCDSLAFTKPDITWLLDVDPTVAAQRISSRGVDDSPLLIDLVEQRSLYMSWITREETKHLLGNTRILSSENWEMANRNVCDAVIELLTMF